MKTPLPHIIRQQTLWISPERCIFWEEANTLIVADLHLGKSGHFRKEGIGIPQSVYKADLQRLMAQLYLYKADRLIIAGDFTHSTANKELDLFLRWRKDFSSLHIDLVKGNHDILEADWYKSAAILVHEWKMHTGPFLFLHDLKAEKDLSPEEKKGYRFAGHLHPAVSLKGKGRQSLRFPCFYFTTEYAVLPAFSRFTGGYNVQPSKNELIFALVDDGIMRLP